MLLVTCFIFGLLGSLTWAVSPVGPRCQRLCPFGTFATRKQRWLYCHKFYEERLNFEEAEENCQSNWRGGHLASITSDTQAKLVNAYVSKENQEDEQVWIGLQRSTESPNWQWTDGSKYKYNGSSSHESKNETENTFCSAIIPKSERMKWTNIDCSLKLPFLCKWKQTRVCRWNQRGSPLIGNLS